MALILSVSDSFGAYSSAGVVFPNYSNLSFSVSGAPTVAKLAHFYVDDVAVGSTERSSSTESFPNLAFGLVSLPEGTHTIKCVTKAYSYVAKTPGWTDPGTDVGTLSITVKSYSPPSVTSFSAKRCISTGVLADDGTYVKYSLTAAIDPVTVSGVNKNTTLIQLRYRVQGTGNWTYHTVSNSLFSLTNSNVVLNLGISASNTYDFGVLLTDRWKAADMQTSLPRDSVIYSYEANQFALGKIADTDGFDCLWPSRFRDTMTLDKAPVFLDLIGTRANLGIQMGTVAFSVAASSATNYAVTFPQAYAEPPQVMITMEGSSSSWTPGAVTAITYAVSATGMTIRVMNGFTGASRSGTIHWRAESSLA